MAPPSAVRKRHHGTDAISKTSRKKPTRDASSSKGMKQRGSDISYLDWAKQEAYAYEFALNDPCPCDRSDASPVSFSPLMHQLNVCQYIANFFL